MQGVGEELQKFCSELAKFWEAVAENKASVAVISCSRNEVSAVNGAAVELLPAMKKSSDMRGNAEKKAQSAEMETLVPVNKKLTAARVNYEALRWNQDKVLSKLKFLEAEHWKSLKTVTERTTEGSSMMSISSKHKWLKTLNESLQSPCMGLLIYLKV